MLYENRQFDTKVVFLCQKVGQFRKVQIFAIVYSVICRRTIDVMSTSLVIGQRSGFVSLTQLAFCGKYLVIVFKNFKK